MPLTPGSAKASCRSETRLHRRGLELVQHLDVSEERALQPEPLPPLLRDPPLLYRMNPRLVAGETTRILSPHPSLTNIIATLLVSGLEDRERLSLPAPVPAGDGFQIHLRYSDLAQTVG